MWFALIKDVVETISVPHTEEPMNPYLLDDLRDWQVVLDKLQELRDACILDDCQPGLARILRYRENWRLRERVLEYATDIRQPCSELLEAILAILSDEGTYINTRILAAEALRVLAPRGLKYDPTLSADLWRSSAIAKLEEILGRPQAPLFRDAVSLALRAIAPERRLQPA